MSQQNQAQSQSLAFQQAELRKQAKELDAREEFLAERERALEEGPLTLAVLEETIKAKQGQLDAANAKLKKAEEAIAAKEAKAEAAFKESYERLEVIERQVVQATIDLDTIAENCRKLEEDKKSIQVEITERKRYLTEQENVIADAIDEGNSALRGIGYEIKAEEEKRDKMRIEVSALGIEIGNLGFEKAQLVESLDGIHSEIIQREEKLKKNIQDAEANLTKVGIENKRITEDTEQKLRTLKEEEEKIIASRQALAKERTEVQTEKRRWESTKSLYGIV